METNKTTKNKIMDFIVKTTNGMAFGLFATLIIGTIINTIANFFTVDSFFNKTLLELANILKLATGAGIGIGISLSLKKDGLKMIIASVAGMITSYTSGEVGMKIGDPLTIYIVVVATILLLDLILQKKTPIDIILIPLLGALISYTISYLISDYVYLITSSISALVREATNLQPFLMGIVIAVLMGMALTAPISSAAIAMSFNLGPIAFGASVVGCSVQMIGFAIMSRKDNSFGVCLSVAIGTSMLQFKNIIKKPLLWLPTIIVSAILGPLATTVLLTECNGVGAGMGTSGLVGPIQTLATMDYSLNAWLSVIILMVVAPLVLVWIIDVIFRKYNLIKIGDLKI